MKKPKLFTPTQEDLERVGNEIAENLSSDKKVIAGEKEIQGQKTSSDDFLKMDLEAQSGSIWTEEKTKGPKKEKKYVENNIPPSLLTDPAFYNGKEITHEIPVIINNK